jgi:hypothetical protein
MVALEYDRAREPSDDDAMPHLLLAGKRLDDKSVRQEEHTSASPLATDQNADFSGAMALTDRPEIPAIFVGHPCAQAALMEAKARAIPARR